MKPCGVPILALLALVIVLPSSPSHAAPPSTWPPAPTIGTASPGGVFLPYGQATGLILTDALGIPVTAQATQGSSQNLLLLENGTIQLGLVRTDVALDSWNVGLFNFAVAHKDLPDDLVYAIVKATFPNREHLIAAHGSAKETLAANVARNGFLPFHPGAVRYYREMGIAIPDNLSKGG